MLYYLLVNFIYGLPSGGYSWGHILRRVVLDGMSRKWLAITSLPVQRRRPVGGGRWPVTHDEGNPFTSGSTRACVSRARTPSSICARGLPPSGPAGNRCRVLSRSCPAYRGRVRALQYWSRRCDGIERCASSSWSVLRQRADVSTLPYHIPLTLTLTDRRRPEEFQTIIWQETRLF